MPMSPRLLRPRQTLHPEAASWASRVVANGGTVSGTTLSAVDKFCKAIASAGIRDRFYRLNLFCGSNLNAALVPLFRTWRVYSGRNLLSVGDNLSASAWTKSGTTVTQSSSERPFAYGPYANVVTATAGTGVTPYVVAGGVTGYGTVTYSAYLKANGQNTVRILPIATAGQTFPGGGTVAFANIDLSTGAISNVLAGTTATATNVGNGWWRLAYTVTNNGTGQTSLRFDIGNGNPYTAAGTESVLFWGLQNELGSTATEFDPYPLGNATDTNVGGLFVSGDYNETGASGGLQGASASSKRLRTGLAQNTMPTGNVHLAAYNIAKSTSSNDVDVGARSNAAGQYSEILLASSATTYGFNNFSVTYSIASDSAYTQAGAFMLGSCAGTAHVLYKNGLSAGTSNAAAAASTSSTFSVFATENEAGAGSDFTNARLGGYSIGLSMTASQAAAYYTAMQAFQTALTRNV